MPAITTKAGDKVMNLENVLRSINKKMLIDFDEISSEIEHRGSKGKVREKEILKEFLTRYCPCNIGLSDGEIISTDDQVSPQTDITLFEKNSTPALLTKEGYQVFPIECVYGVMEVKSFLDKAQLQDSFEKIKRIKKMPKLAYEAQRGPVIQSTTLYDKEWPYFPTLGFVIAFDSLDLKTLKSHYLDLIAGHPPEQQIDSVWVLKKGMLINYNPTTNMIEMAPSSKTFPRSVSSDNPLMLLTIHLQSLLASGWMPKFMIANYLGACRNKSRHRLMKEDYSLKA